MPAAEGSPDRADHRSSGSSSPGGLYVKHDLYPKASSVHSSDREDDEVDHQPMLKLARYAVSPNTILPFHQQNFYEAHQTSSPLPRRKQVIRFEAVFVVWLAHLNFIDPRHVLGADQVIHRRHRTLRRCHCYPNRISSYSCRHRRQFKTCPKICPSRSLQW